MGYGPRVNNLVKCDTKDLILQAISSQDSVLCVCVPRISGFKTQTDASVAKICIFLVT